MAGLHGKKYMYPAKLNSKHRQLMRLLAIRTPMDEAARESGFTLLTARQVASSPFFKQELNKLQDAMDGVLVDEVKFNFRTRLEGEIKESIETLVKLRDGAESEQVQMKSAAELLDRAGVKTADKFEGSMTMEADGDVFAMLQTALREMRGKGKESEKVGKPDLAT